MERYYERPLLYFFVKGLTTMKGELNMKKSFNGGVVVGLVGGLLGLMLGAGMFLLGTMFGYDLKENNDRRNAEVQNAEH